MPGVRRGLPRWLEVMMAAGGLVVVSPILLVAAVLVRLSSPGPVLFRQVRIGRGGRPFVMLKFRTMGLATEGPNVTAGGDPRITAVGRVLRQTKIDELPELWNVVRGDMSFVGPRPEVPELVNLEDPQWKEILQVRPGITDPVTLALRNEEDLIAEADEDAEMYYKEFLQPFKLRGYVEYVENRSAWGDMKVLVRTIVAVVLPASNRPPSLEEIRRASGRGAENP